MGLSSLILRTTVTFFAFLMQILRNVTSYFAPVIFYKAGFWRQVLFCKQLGTHAAPAKVVFYFAEEREEKTE